MPSSSIPTVKEVSQSESSIQETTIKINGKQYMNSTTYTTKVRSTEKQPEKEASIDDDDTSSNEQQIDQQGQNLSLKNKIYDLEMRERGYISKILQLEMRLAKINLEKSLIKTKPKNNISLKIPQNDCSFKLTKSVIQNNTARSCQPTKQQKKFCEAFRNSYNFMFGISDLKGIWKKHKQILQNWVLTRN